MYTIGNVPWSLPANELHIWRVALDRDPAEFSELEPLLSSGERKRAARFRFERDRNRYLVSHGILRKVLSGYLQSPFEYRYGPEGKPEIPGADLRFNLSHSGDLALIGASQGRELGIDIEQVRASVDDGAIAKRFFSAYEFEKLSALPEEQRDQAFFRIWTRKEAYVKARGGGLFIPLDSFDVSLDAGQAELLRAPDLERWAIWNIVDLPRAGYLAAVVAERGIESVRFFTV